MIEEKKLRCGLCGKPCEDFFCSKECEEEYRYLNHIAS